MSIIKNQILDEVDGLVKNFTYYDRKEDEELTEEILDNAIMEKEITIDEIVDKFRNCLIETYPDLKQELEKM